MCFGRSDLLLTTHYSLVIPDSQHVVCFGSVLLQLHTFIGVDEVSGESGGRFRLS